MQARVALLGQPQLDELPELQGRNTTTEVLAREVADRLAAGVAEGALGPTAPTRLTAIGVTLREADDIRAYEQQRAASAPWLFSND